jgi:hypothetical protein
MKKLITLLTLAVVCSLCQRQEIAWCGDRKFPAPRLLCTAGCVMDSKWSGGGGMAQVRFRPGGPGAGREPERRFSRARWLATRN